MPPPSDKIGTTAIFLLTVCFCLTYKDAMSTPPKPPPQHARLTARLPAPLAERVQREAARRYCSASDVIRLSLAIFFDDQRQTKQDGGPA